MPYLWLLIGIPLGILIALPVIFYLIRRTEQRVNALAQRAQNAERLAELGTLTGGLAHEIKNPLSTIGLNLQLLRENIDDAELPPPLTSRLTKRIESVRSETDRLRDILEDFLSFAGRIRIHPHPVQVNDIVEQLSDFYSPQAEQNDLKLRTQLHPEAGSIQADTTLLKQALLNLLINADQAMIEARVSERPHGGSNELILKTLPTPNGVEIHIIDTGPGIDEDTVKRIFQPYFTTKHGGTGLGLSTTRRIINEHGGDITAHTQPGHGTDFTITLPRTVRNPANTDNQ